MCGAHLELPASRRVLVERERLPLSVECRAGVRAEKVSPAAPVLSILRNGIWRGGDALLVENLSVVASIGVPALEGLLVA